MTLRIFDVNVSAVVAAEEDPDGLQKPGYQNFAVSQLVGNKILQKNHFIEASTFNLKVLKSNRNIKEVKSFVIIIDVKRVKSFVKT
jgi:hypothetical protein